MNILFIIPSPNSYDEVDEWLTKKSIKRYIPEYQCSLGILELASYLRKHIDPINIKVIDVAKNLKKLSENYENVPTMNYEDFLKREINNIDFEPDIIGFSILFSSSYNGTVKLMEIAKNRWVNSTIICGGNHATNWHENLLKIKEVDYVIRGEAELTFTEFVKNRITNDKKKIKGVVDRKIVMDSLNEDNNELEHKRRMSSWRWEMSPMINDLDDIPIAAYDLIDVDYYRNKGANVMMSRGCVYDCSFCATKTIHGMGVRYKSKQRFYDEINHLVNELKFKTIMIQDDMIGAHKDRFFDMIDVLAQFKNQAKYLFPNGLAVTYTDEEMLDAYCEIGVERFLFSIESGTEYTMRHMVRKGKGVDLNKTKRLINYLRGKNKQVDANFILGFPGETVELMQKTIDYIHTLNLDWAFIFSALPLPGTRIFKDFCDQGIINKDKFDFDGLRHGRRTFDTPEISANNLEKLVYDANIHYNFFENQNFKEGKHDKAIFLWDQMVNNNYPYHIVGRYCRALAKEGKGEFKEAEADFKDCIKWINSNNESKKLYETYRNKMPRLESYFNKLVPPHGLEPRTY